MTLDLLDAPLRVTWDLGGPQGLPAAELHRVARRLLDAGVFFATLQERAIFCPILPELVERLHSGGVQTTLLIEYELLENGSVLPGWPLAHVDVDVSSCCRQGEFRPGVLGQKLSELRAMGYNPGLSLPPRVSHLSALCGFFDFARSENVQRVKLPNLSQVGRAVPASEVPRATDLEHFARIWRDHPVSLAGLSLEIHDLFFWELLLPCAERQNYRGCQAGNSLAHIAADGRLFPCISWPEALGSLLEDDLADLWRSQGRLALRKQLVREPAECSGCAIYLSCFGGCRGLVRSLADAECRDLLCAAVRPPKS